MGIFRSLSKMFHGSRSPRPPASRRLVLEALEDRLCLSYSVIDLGILPGTARSSAVAVNESGQVVGNSYTNALDDGHAFLWQNGIMTDLGSLGSSVSWASDINDSGQVVGGSYLAFGPGEHAFLWANEVMSDLGTLLGGNDSHPTAINNHSQIVGTSSLDEFTWHAFVWENGVMYDLNTLLPPTSGWDQLRPNDINDNGQIVGMGSFNGQQRAFRITDPDGIFGNGGAVITNLGTLRGGSSSVASAMNSLGQIAGTSEVITGKGGSQDFHAFLYDNGTMKDLKTLSGPDSFANGINDVGQVVGSSMYIAQLQSGPVHAFLWQNGKMTDLNKQLPRGSGWTLGGATDINNAGWIVGGGVIGSQGRAFLMAPGSTLQAESVSTVAVTETIGLDQVQLLIVEALALWQVAGADVSSLGAVDVRISDLGGTTLGLASGNTIWLDDNAAGWGWFVDATPWDDSEFTTPGDQGEQGKMDLLTTLAHEIGHLLAHDHAEDGLMADTLDLGERHMPDTTSWSIDAAIVEWALTNKK